MFSAHYEIMWEQVSHLAHARPGSLEFTGAAKELLLAEGSDLNFGARPVKRSVQRLVQDLLAMEILHGHIFDGDRVVVDAEQNKMKFTCRAGDRWKSPSHKGIVQ